MAERGRLWAWGNVGQEGVQACGRVCAKLLWACGRAGVWVCECLAIPRHPYWSLRLRVKGEARSGGAGVGRVQAVGGEAQGVGWGSGRDGEAGWSIKGSPADRPT